MEMKEEALKLADDLWEKRDVFTGDLLEQSSAMIRRLVEELDRLDYDLKSLANRYKALDRTKPLSDEEIQNIWYQHEKWLATVPLSFARAIEERHGIK